MQDLLVKPSFALIQPSGHVNAGNSGELQAQLMQAIAPKNKAAVVVDLSQVESLDSAGLMVLVSAMNAAQQAGLRFSLCALPPAVRIVFEVTQLDRVFEIFESVTAFEETFA